MKSRFGFSRLSRKSPSSTETDGCVIAQLLADFAKDPVDWNLSSQRLGDTALQALAEEAAKSQKQPSLRTLDLSSNRLTNAAIPSVARILESCPLLAELNLSQNRLKGLKAVHPLRGALLSHPALGTLRIGGNELGPDAIGEISALFQSAPRLACVDLGWKCFAKSVGGAVVVDDRASTSSSLGLAPKRFMTMLSQHVVISPDGHIAKKLTGGDSFNANIQWELPEADAAGCFSYTFEIQSTPEHWVAVGWAPECILPDVKQYSKYGCYLTSTGFACGPGGTPSASLNVEERGTARVIRATYDPNSHVATWQNFSTGAPGELLCVFNEVSIFPALYPTICFGHQGGTICLLDGAEFKPRKRAVNENSGSGSSGGSVHPEADSSHS